MSLVPHSDNNKNNNNDNTPPSPTSSYYDNITDSLLQRPVVRDEDLVEDPVRGFGVNKPVEAPPRTLAQVTQDNAKLMSVLPKLRAEINRLQEICDRPPRRQMVVERAVRERPLKSDMLVCKIESHRRIKKKNDK
eukprot:PhM_4_TR15624/c1_g2_i1/m.10694